MPVKIPFLPARPDPRCLIVPGSDVCMRSGGSPSGSRTWRWAELGWTAAGTWPLDMRGCVSVRLVLTKGLVESFQMLPSSTFSSSFSLSIQANGEARWPFELLFTPSSYFWIWIKTLKQTPNFPPAVLLTGAWMNKTVGVKNKYAMTLKTQNAKSVDSALIHIYAARQ